MCLCRGSSCPCLGVSFPWLPVEGLNLGYGVYVFALAQLAASDERMGRTRLKFKLILQSRHLSRNGNWLSASNARHSTIALHQFCNHLSLARGRYEEPEY